MISVEEAQQVINQCDLNRHTLNVSIDNSIGYYLAEPILADRDFPPFDRITMDGIAIRYEDFESGIRSFKVTGVAAAGSEISSLSEKYGCMEVMTGAVLPEGTDTVIRYEDISIEDGQAKIQVEQINKGQNIHYQGEDKNEGELLVSPGDQISASVIALAASVGKHELKVAKPPKAVIISTGDELVDIDQTPLPHQIRRSNNHMIKAALNSLKIECEDLHLQDDLELIVAALKNGLQHYDMIFISGGVSKGKFDFIPEALKKLKVEEKFHRIKQRPGKPFWFGVYQRTTPVFAFPGNPVSSYLCYHIYVHPWLIRILGGNPTPLKFARLSETVHFKPDLTNFLQVTIAYNENGNIEATPLPGHGSGDLTNLVKSQAFLRLDPGTDDYPENTSHPLYLFTDI